MATSNPININISGSNTEPENINDSAIKELTNSLNNLSSKMSGFESALNNFKAATIDQKQVKEKKLVTEQSTIQTNGQITDKLKTPKVELKTDSHPLPNLRQENALKILEARKELANLAKSTQESKQSVANYKKDIETAKISALTNPDLLAANIKKQEIDLKKIETRKDIVEATKSIQETKAKVQTNPEVIAQRKIQAESTLTANLANKQRQEAASKLLELGKQQLENGNVKWGHDLIDRAADAINKGATKAFSDKNIWGAITAVGGGAIAEHAANQYINANTQLGHALLANPMLNGYDYGGTVANITNLQAQKNASIFQAGAAAIGGTAGYLVGGIKGAGIGAGISTAAAGTLSAYELGKTAIQSQAQSTFINNQMRMEALRATNAPANAIAQSATTGKKLTDIEVPFIMAISKGIGIYNDNFKAMDKLTKNVINFSQAAQLDLGTAGQMANTIGYFSRNKDFNFDETKQIFKAYGTTDYAGVLNSAVNFNQAGFGTEKSIQLAAEYQQMNAGFQNTSNQYYSDTFKRGQSNLIAKSFGIDPEAYRDPLNPDHTKAFENVTRLRNTAISNVQSNPTKSMIAQNILSMSGIGDATTVPLNDFQNRAIGTIPIGTTGKQSAINSSINNITDQALHGTLDAGQAGQSLKNLTLGADSSASSLNAVSFAAKSATDALSALARLFRSSTNNNITSNGASSMYGGIQPKK